MIHNDFDVTINIDGRACTEFEPKRETDVEAQNDQEIIVRYIEAIAGADFTIFVSAKQKPSSLRQAEAISIQLIIDGDEQTFALGFKKDGFMSIIRGRNYLEDGEFFAQKFFFDNLITRM